MPCSNYVYVNNSFNTNGIVFQFTKKSTTMGTIRIVSIYPVPQFCKNTKSNDYQVLMVSLVTICNGRFGLYHLSNLSMYSCYFKQNMSAHIRPTVITISFHFKYM
jgi:hypothetical protein